MLKRICAFCLIMVLTVSLLSVMPVSAASEADIQLVADLGIIDISESVGLIPQGFDRGDFARSLCLMERNSNPPEVSAEEAATYAYDIAANENCSFIAAVLSAGYMQTDGEGNFNPGKSISLSDAVTAIVKMLGYEPMAQRNGGTYNAYYQIALRIGIMKGVLVEDNEKLTAEETAKILTNTMEAKMFIPDNINYSEDCLWNRWHITVHEGKILANSNIGILVERTSPGYINIDGNLYPTNLMVENDIVGSIVTYYTMPGDNGDKVVSIYIKNSSETVTLKPDEIQAVTDNGSTLTIEIEDKKSLKVDKKGFLIVNGKTMSPAKAMFDAFESGTATFVDSDSNGVYDVVHMTLLFQTIIEGVNTDTKTLRTRFDDQLIKLEDIDAYEIYLGKKVADIFDLSSGMPVGIACDSFTLKDGQLVLNFTNAEYVRIYASSRVSTGYVTALHDDGRFEIDEMSKRYGSGYTRLTALGHIQPLKLGQCVTAYFDNLGELTYFEIAKGSGLNYGYLIKAGITGGTLTETSKVKILDTDGKFNIYELGNSFILDGERVKSDATVYTVNTANDVDLTKRQLVRFRAEDGILKELDTKVIRSGVENTEGSLDESLPFDVNKTGNSKYTVRSGAINRKFAFASGCAMFIDEAPISEENPPENRFSVARASGLGDVEYYMAGYDTNENREISCVVRYDSYGSTTAGEKIRGLAYHLYNCYVVEDVVNALNKNGEWSYKLTLAGDSKKATYFTSVDNLKLYTTKTAADWNGETVFVYKEDPANLTNVIKKGDIVRFKTNAAGEISYIEKDFDFASHKNTFAEVPDASGQIYGFAKVEKISGNNIIYSYGGDERFISMATQKIPSVSLYHVNTGEVEVLTIKEIPSAATGNNVKCFLRYYNYGKVMDNIFYIYD